MTRKLTFYGSRHVAVLSHSLELLQMSSLVHSWLVVGKIHDLYQRQHYKHLKNGHNYKIKVAFPVAIYGN